MRGDQFWQGLIEGDSSGSSHDDLAEIGKRELRAAAGNGADAAFPSDEAAICVARAVGDGHVGMLCLRPQGKQLELVVRGYTDGALLVSDVAYPSHPKMGLDEFVKEGTGTLASQLSASVRNLSRDANWRPTAVALAAWLSGSSETVS